MEDLKRQLKNNGVYLKKKYGQNFLQDTTLLNKIVDQANIQKQDTVVEIGCGAGALTKVLSERAKKVYGYEIDTSLKPILSQNLEGAKNVEITYKDIMKENIETLEKKIGCEYSLVANLPYYITTSIVMLFLENAKNLKSMSIMVQEEVADRFCSKSGVSDYGAVTVGINLRGSAQKVLRVPREMFTPIPNVDSAVVRIDIEKDKFKDVDYKKVRECVRIAFSSRRKMLVNNLMNGYKINRERAEKILLEGNISLTDRGENLTAEQFVSLTNVIIKNNI